jgi:hypothetical protein
MSDWIPPGYVSVVALVGEHGVDKVRSDLFSGRLQAYTVTETAGEFLPIEPRIWCANEAEQWLAQGWLPYYKDKPPPCLIVVRAEDEPKPQFPTTDDAYVSPFMKLMREAVQHFGISEKSWPTKKELEHHFLAQKLPDGTSVSVNQASQLATLCRPLAALRGGSPKGG